MKKLMFFVFLFVALSYSADDVVNDDVVEVQVNFDSESKIFLVPQGVSLLVDAGVDFNTRSSRQGPLVLNGISPDLFGMLLAIVTGNKVLDFTFQDLSDLRELSDYLQVSLTAEAIFSAMDYVTNETFKYLYIMWLNENPNAPVFHDQFATKIVDSMNIALDNVFKIGGLGVIHLTTEDTAQISNYEQRKVPETIQDLINRNQIRIFPNGVLSLKDAPIQSLYGLGNIPNKEKVKKLQFGRETINLIPTGVFEGFEHLETLQFMGKVYQIAPNAFGGAYKLKKLLFEDSVYHIAPLAFGELWELRDFKISHNNYSTQSLIRVKKDRPLWFNE